MKRSFYSIEDVFARPVKADREVQQEISRRLERVEEKLQSRAEAMQQEQLNIQRETLKEAELCMIL